VIRQVINKIDLAPYVGASLEVMDRDSRRMRADRRFLFTDLKTGKGLDAVVAWVEEQYTLPRRPLWKLEGYVGNPHSHSRGEGDSLRHTHDGLPEHTHTSPD